jgi:hypothetical protein
MEFLAKESLKLMQAAQLSDSLQADVFNHSKNYF